MSTTTIILAIAVGLAAGVLSGLFGVGGGILFVPALVALGLGQVEAAATSLLAVVPTAAVGTWRQARYGNLRVKPALVVGVASIVGRRDRRADRDVAARARRCAVCSACCSSLVAAQLAWRARAHAARATLRRGETRPSPRGAASGRPRGVDRRCRSAAAGGARDRGHLPDRAAGPAGRGLAVALRTSGRRRRSCPVTRTRRTARSCASGRPTRQAAAQPSVSSTAQATVGALAVSLFDGEITIESVDMRASVAAGSANASGERLGVDGERASRCSGSSSPPPANVVVPLADWGSLELLGSQVETVQEPPRSAKATATAVRVKLIADHGGLPRRQRDRDRQRRDGRDGRAAGDQPGAAGEAAREAARGPPGDPARCAPRARASRSPEPLPSSCARPRR